MIIEGTNPGAFKTLSDVLALNGYMYFRGTDNSVWRVNATDPNDHANFGGPGVVAAAGNVFPAADGYLYFRGTDGKAWRMHATEPYNPATPGNFTAESDVFAADGYMYFQGKDHAIWQVSAEPDPKVKNNFGGPGVAATESAVYPGGDGYVYFRGTDGKARRMHIAEPYSPTAPGNFTAATNVFAVDDAMYFQGAGHLVWRYDFHSGTLADYATAAVITLQNWYDTQAGVWLVPQASGGETQGWWNSANALYALIDYMSYTRTNDYMSVIENTFSKNKGGNSVADSGGNFLNPFYDDEGWWALAWINAYDFAGDPAQKQDYLNMAKTIFEDMTKGWYPQTCNGGILWEKGTQIKNSIENLLFLAVAIRLYQRVPEAEQAQYRGWLDRVGKWTNDYFTDSRKLSATHLVHDGLWSKQPDPCIPNPKSPNIDTYTYTQGVLIGALTDMDAEKVDYAGQPPLPLARQIADAAMSHLVQGGILTEYGPADPSAYSNLNQFKGIFIRNLAHLAAHIGAPGNASYVSFIQRNANSVLASDRNFGNQFGYRWQGPFDQANAVRQTSAIEALNAAMRMGITSP